MKTLKQAWLSLIKEILNKKETNVVEDEYIEIAGKNITFSFKNCFELTKDNKINVDYLEMQKVFFSNSDNIFGHSYVNSMLTPFTDIQNPVEAISKKLNENLYTRNAVLLFSTYKNNKIPCINSIQFLYRNGKLNMFFTARSQDIYRKFPCDVMCFSLLATKIAEKLNLKLGAIHANIISAHIYIKDLEKALFEIKNV